MVKIGESWDLTRLLAPHISPEQFFEEYFEKKHLHIERGQEDFYEPVFGLYDVEPVARRCLEEGGEMMLKKDGHDMRASERPPQDCFIGYLLGGSYVMNHADLYHPELAQLCADLRETLAHVYANLYLTPPRSQAVKAHTDDQDVIILQVAGCKRWTLYDSPVTLPYTHEMVGKTGPERAVTPEMKSNVITDLTLNPGDLLYLPRGMMHEARTEGSKLSLHLTLTVPSHDFTWAKFGAHAMTALLMEETGSLRSMVPAGTLVGGFPGGDQEQAMLDKMLQTIKDRLTLEGAQQSFAQKIRGHNQAQDRVCENEEYSRVLPRQIRMKSAMRLRRGMQLEFDDSAKKTNPFCRLIVRNEGRVLEQAVDREHIMIYHAIAATKGEIFSAQELPGDGYSQICVCKLLLRQEVIDIREECPQGSVPHRVHQSKPQSNQSNPGMPAIVEEEEEEGELLYSG